MEKHFTWSGSSSSVLITCSLADRCCRKVEHDWSMVVRGGGDTGRDRGTRNGPPRHNKQGRLEQEGALSRKTAARLPVALPLRQSRERELLPTFGRGGTKRGNSQPRGFRWKREVGVRGDKFLDLPAAKNNSPRAKNFGGSHDCTS